MSPDFDSMNETDVREILVRPLLDRLGYAHGQTANIRTEVTLRYDRAFLGRKNPTKDPPLVGRADYVCDATSYARWVVEVKAPSHELTQDDVQQAHTYSAHPDIAALYFLLTNGREYRLYATGQLEEPLLAWTHEQTEERMMNLFNLVGFNALRGRMERDRPDPAKPLGAGIPSRVRIVGGEVRYGEHRSNHPLMQVDALNGTVAGVNGGSLSRDADGRLHAEISIRNAYQQFTAVNRLAGLTDVYDFYSADEFISTDVARPTILQNVIRAHLDPGVRTQLFPGFPELVIPFGFDVAVFTEATGFLREDEFVGLLTFSYDYQFIRGGRSDQPQFNAVFQNMPLLARLEGVGEFSVRIARD